MSVGDFFGDLGKGALGVMGSFLEQSPITRPLMHAGRAGLMAARSGETAPEDLGADWGTMFLNVAPSFGYKDDEQRGLLASDIGPAEGLGGGGAVTNPAGDMVNPAFFTGNDREYEAPLERGLLGLVDPSSFRLKR